MDQINFNKIAIFHYLNEDSEGTRTSAYDCTFLGFSIDNKWENTYLGYTESIFAMTIPLPFIAYEKATSKKMEEYEAEEELTPKERLKKLKSLCSASVKLFVDILKKNFMNNQEMKEVIFEAIKYFLEDNQDVFQDIDSYVIKHIFKKIMVNEEDKLRLSILLKEV